MNSATPSAGARATKCSNARIAMRKTSLMHEQSPPSMIPIETCLMFFTEAMTSATSSMDAPTGQAHRGIQMSTADAALIPTSREATMVPQCKVLKKLGESRWSGLWPDKVKN